MSGLKHKLHNALEGALAGGTDPVSSPLYVFGPFLKMLVTAGVAQVTFGTSMWLVIFTIATASIMYKYVMQCVTDGSGGNGLCKEEFGYQAFKINAAISYIEFTLIFLVCISALLTLLSDRFPAFDTQLLGIEIQTIIALGLSFLIGWMVNHSPKIVSAMFIPATAGVLILLWIMVVEAIIKTGFHLPSFNIEAFKPQYLHYTILGYVRVLAVMAGIEIFANLVPDYEEDQVAKSKKAFRSLSIIMITTAATTLILGPAIFSLSDPTSSEISVFTQTMDILLPKPMALIGSFVGMFVLLYACAASVLGMQNLTANLSRNHYMPDEFCSKSNQKAIEKPVRLEILVVSICLLVIGLKEEFYLEMYDAGVFIIISQTGWAVLRHLIHNLKAEPVWRNIGIGTATMVTTILTSTAAVLILFERFSEGAWVYFVLIPLFFVIFSYFHKHYRDSKANNLLK